MTSKIVTLTGPSGVGKTTIMRELLKAGFRFLKSTTTREKRESDLDGEYEYFSEQEFTELKEDGDFAWSVEFHGHFYGTRISNIKKMSQEPGFYMMAITPDCVRYLKTLLNQLEIKHYPIFMFASFQNCEDRMKTRGEKPETIESRMRNHSSWHHQASLSGDYDFVIYNNGPLDEVEQISGGILEIMGIV